MAETHQSNHLYPALLEFILQLGKGTKLGGADRGEIGWVREEDRPVVADKLVEVNLALCGQSLEVGCYLISALLVAYT
jgi:hypothetical protein